MAKKADKELLHAVLQPRKPGALKKIAEACSAGADPDAVCPDTSTPTGHVRAGNTLLTHSIHECNSNAVKKLLECGADPNLADANGWTPWMASTLADESKRRRIQDVLAEYGADRNGDHIGDLVRAIAAGDVEQATALIESDKDMGIVATFRVDLVGHQIRHGQAPMLALLLERGMTASSTNFINSIRNSNLEALDILLRSGMPPETDKDGETPLMTAASMGVMAIVQRLVEAGADVNRSADDDGEWTPLFYARQAGHTEVANWLASRMSKSALEYRDQLEAARDPRYRLLYQQATASESLSTDDIVRRLEQWHEKYGVTVHDAKGDSVTVEFSSLPQDLDEFFREILDLCPDSSDSEREIRSELAKTRQLFLWWD